MASEKTPSSDNDATIGCLALIVLGIVFSVISFVMEHWEWFAGAAVVIAALVMAVGAISTHHDSTIGRQRALEASAAQTRRAHESLVEQARQAGRTDMRAAWLERQIRPASVRQSNGGPWSVSEALAVIPKADWAVSRLRTHGCAVWALRGGAPGQHPRPEVEARLDRVAAMISDRTDEEFDSACGQTSDRYLYHRDREVRAAYLEGGAQAVDVIMGTITAARARAREDAATKAAAEAMAQRRNAELKALRETQQATTARDAHADWEEQARKIDE